MNKIKRIFASNNTTAPNPEVPNLEKGKRRRLFRRSASGDLSSQTIPKLVKKMSWSHTNRNGSATREVDFRRVGEQRVHAPAMDDNNFDIANTVVHELPPDLQPTLPAPPNSKIKTIGALALNATTIGPAVGLSAGKDREHDYERDYEPTSPMSATTRQNEADEFIQRAIQYHEADELEKATRYFKLAADKNSPLGLFLYGIALRHGWGCEPNPKSAVKYLQKAAQSAVYDLHASVLANPSIARDELVLAIYELGQCFRQGWGVPKNKSTAAYYFEIAANLGDPDAQNDLGFCYANGIGVKKDMKKAAKYYRMAAAQGSEVMGNSWIWKEKYSGENMLPSERKSASR